MAVVRIAIVSGHSAVDPGAIAMHGGVTYKERDLNDRLVFEIMKASPLSAYFWRADADCDNLEYPDYLKRRVHNINQQGDVAAAVAIHHNSCGNPRRTGAEVIYWDTSQSGYLLARRITQEMVCMPMKVNIVPALKQLGRKLYFLRKTKPPAVIIEPGFMSNAEDLQFVINHRAAIADAIRAGVGNWAREMYADEKDD